MVATEERVNVRERTHHRVCNFCEAMCGLEITIAEAASGTEPQIKVRPDRNDPFSKGSMCPKAAALSSLHADSSRLRHPVIKVGGNWEPVSWNEAYTLVEQKLRSIRERYGEDAIASYLGNPIVHNLGMMLFVKALTKAIGSRNVFSATSMDQLPHHFVAHYMFGHEFRIPVPDIDRTQFMLVLGANPVASNGSMMTSAGVEDRLKNILSGGGKVVVIDPRRTETAVLASAHHFIRPGTDVYFLLGFLHTVFRDGHARPGKLLDHITGYEQLETLVHPFSPDAVSGITGISGQTLETLVRDVADRDRAVIYGRMGLSTQAHGGLCQWLINTLNIVLGNFDTAGGMMFPSPAIELVREKEQPATVGRWSSRVRRIPEFYGELPVSTLAEEITTSGNGQVKALMTVCGNPVLSTPGGNRLDDALPDLEFMFSIDNYINETTRHADLILPTPAGLEIDHYDLIFNLISVSNNVKFSEAAFPTDPDRPYDWQILKELAKRMSRGKLDLFERLATPRRIVNWGLMLGRYGRLSHPSRWFSGLTLNKVIASKHGISLGPLQPRVPECLLTPDRKINIADRVFTDQLQKLGDTEFGKLSASVARQREINEFELIGRRHVSTNNSWMHQFKKLSRSRQVRCTCMMNPDDGAGIGVTDMADVTVSSRVGEIVLPVELTNTMMPGVVCIPHGFGHTRADTRVPNAQAKPGVSVNDITDHLRIDSLTGNAAFSGLPVVIEPVHKGDSVAPEVSSEITGKPITILYGSRTGNAQFLAKDAATAARSRGLVPTVCAMDDIQASDLPQQERLLVITSTYGDGDMPDNAGDLWAQISDNAAPCLDNTFFAVLALGDTSYETFCAAGKQWDSRLAALGATRVTERVDCDVDYSESADRWIEIALDDIHDVGSDTVVTVNPEHRQSVYLRDRADKDNPLTGRVTAKHMLTDAGSSKHTCHYEISLNGAEALYTPGDIVNVCVRNDMDLVSRLLDVTCVDGAEIVDGRNLADHLQSDKEIRLPSTSLLKLLAAVDESPLSDLLKPHRRQELEQYLHGRDVIQLLKEHPYTVTDTDTLLSVLRPLTPRSYSVSSSPLTHPGKVHLTVATVRYEAFDRTHTGVGSGYLADHLALGDDVSFYFVANRSFSLPEDDSVPVIMVGPGTGVAPFRGFLHERAGRDTSGLNWLFFGERNEQTDFLYRDELESLRDTGVLTRLDLAFSRDQAEKVYVQDRMREHGAEIFQWLEASARFYVCGDAGRMAEDVDRELRRILQEHGNMSQAEADRYVENLKTTRRYVRDVY